MQAITADTVIAYITHDHRSSISSASKAGMERSDVAACVRLLRQGKVNGVQQLATRLTVTRTNMPYLIAQCYLSPGRGDIPALAPAEVTTQFSDPGGCKAELT